MATTGIRRPLSARAPGGGASPARQPRSEDLVAESEQPPGSLGQWTSGTRARHRRQHTSEPCSGWWCRVAPVPMWPRVGGLAAVCSPLAGPVSCRGRGRSGRPVLAPASLSAAHLGRGRGRGAGLGAASRSASRPGLDRTRGTWGCRPALSRRSCVGIGWRICASATRHPRAGETTLKLLATSPRPRRIGRRAGSSPRLTPRMRTFTGDYIKVWSIDRRALKQWARTETGAERDYGLQSLHVKTGTARRLAGHASCAALTVILARLPWSR